MRLQPVQAYSETAYVTRILTILRGVDAHWGFDLGDRGVGTYAGIGIGDWWDGAGGITPFRTVTANDYFTTDVAASMIIPICILYTRGHLSTNDPLCRHAVLAGNQIASASGAYSSSGKTIARQMDGTGGVHPFTYKWACEALVRLYLSGLSGVNTSQILTVLLDLGYHDYSSGAGTLQNDGRAQCLATAVHCKWLIKQANIPTTLTMSGEADEAFDDFVNNQMASGTPPNTGNSNGDFCWKYYESASSVNNTYKPYYHLQMLEGVLHYDAMVSAGFLTPSTAQRNKLRNMLAQAIGSWSMQGYPVSSSAQNVYRDWATVSIVTTALATIINNPTAFQWETGIANYARYLCDRTLEYVGSLDGQLMSPPHSVAESGVVDPADGRPSPIMNGKATWSRFLQAAITRVSATSFTVASDITASCKAGMFIRCYSAATPNNTFCGVVGSATFGAGVTTVVMATGTVTAGWSGNSSDMIAEMYISSPNTYNYSASEVASRLAQLIELGDTFFDIVPKRPSFCTRWASSTGLFYVNTPRYTSFMPSKKDTGAGNWPLSQGSSAEPAFLFGPNGYPAGSYFNRGGSGITQTTARLFAYMRDASSNSFYNNYNSEIPDSYTITDSQGTITDAKTPVTAYDVDLNLRRLFPQVQPSSTGRKTLKSADGSTTISPSYDLSTKWTYYSDFAIKRVTLHEATTPTNPGGLATIFPAMHPCRIYAKATDGNGGNAQTLWDGTTQANLSGSTANLQWLLFVSDSKGGTTWDSAYVWLPVGTSKTFYGGTADSADTFRAQPNDDNEFDRFSIGGVRVFNFKAVNMTGYNSAWTEWAWVPLVVPRGSGISAIQTMADNARDFVDTFIAVRSSVGGALVPCGVQNWYPNGNSFGGMERKVGSPMFLKIGSMPALMGGVAITYYGGYVANFAAYLAGTADLQLVGIDAQEVDVSLDGTLYNNLPVVNGTVTVVRGYSFDINSHDIRIVRLHGESSDGAENTTNDTPGNQNGDTNSYETAIE